MDHLRLKPNLDLHKICCIMNCYSLFRQIHLILLWVLKTGRLWMHIGVIALMGMPGATLAQSACTAMWGIVVPATTGPSYLGYFNNSAGTAQKFTTLSFTLSANQANALAVDPTTGTPYYFDRTALTVRTVNLNAYTTATVGTITPASPDGNGNILGAFVDTSGNLIMMSNAGANLPMHLAIVSKTVATTNAVWQTVTYAGGALPANGGSGDLYTTGGATPQTYLISNTAPVAVYPLAITVVNGSITSVIASASVTFATGPASVGGIAINPNTGISYFGGATAAQNLYSLNPATANSEVLVDASSNLILDLASCAATPAAPSISKTFSPTYASLTNTTTTLFINFANSNSLPIWLNSTFTDQLPTGMTVAATPSLNGGACAASTTVTNVITATAGQTTMTFANGGRIPAGGCTVSFNVTAAAQTNGYTNTIAIGSLTATAGANTTATSATYKVGTDFSAVKSQCVGVCGTTSTSVVTIGGGQTVQYILTITNSVAGGTGSVTFIDTLPALMTPVLSITANMIGGGTCSTATAVLGGATQVTGTLTNAPAGAQCTVTVTSLVSQTQTVSTSVTNTLTLAPVSSTSDTNGTNNTATVPTIVKASANLTVAKTNGVSTLVAGATTSYTITVANLGPAAAPGTTLFDPIVAGLNCTSVTCTSTAANMCPVGPTIAALQSGGLQVSPTFAINTSASFVVTCGVTATGQ